MTKKLTVKETYQSHSAWKNMMTLKICLIRICFVSFIGDAMI